MTVTVPRIIEVIALGIFAVVFVVTVIVGALWYVSEKAVEIVVEIAPPRQLAQPLPAPSLPIEAITPASTWQRYEGATGTPFSFSIPTGFSVVQRNGSLAVVHTSSGVVGVLIHDEGETVRFESVFGTPPELAAGIIATFERHEAPRVFLPPPAPSATQKAWESVYQSPSSDEITITPVINPPPVAPPPPTDVVPYLCTLPNRSDANPDGTKRDKVFRSIDGRFYWRSGPDIWMYYDTAARFVALCPWDDWCNSTLPTLTFETTDLCIGLR